MLFISKDYSKIFVVNFKCCFSTFCNLVLEKKILRLSGEYDNILNDNYKFVKKDVKIYMIIRNPYDRFLSFYKDKFRLCFNGKIKNNNNQLCHKIIYKYFPKEKIENMNFTINNLVDCIKKGYWDGHLSLQTDILKSDVLKNNIFHNNITFIKLEEENFNDKIEKIIYHKIKNYHSSASDNTKLSELSEENKLYISKIYENDFKLLNYDL